MEIIKYIVITEVILAILILHVCIFFLIKEGIKELWGRRNDKSQRYNKWLQ